MPASQGVFSLYREEIYMSLLHWMILTPFIFAFVVACAHRISFKFHIGYAVCAVPIILFCYYASLLPIISKGGVIEKTFSWVSALGINFTVYLDGLSLLFTLLITGIGALVVLYSAAYLSKEKENLFQFYTYLLMFMGAMLGVVQSDNMIVMYVFWEITSLSSMLLIGYWYQRKQSIIGAQKSFLITVFGGFAMLAGFCVLFSIGDSFSIRELIANRSDVMGSGLFVPAMILILLGAFTKSAQFPFHIWLPDAMEAPTPVSAYLHSATMVKAGIYLVARFTPLFGGSSVWFWVIALTGITTLLWGSISAVRQKDMKAILAFSTISQLGLIMSLLGIGSAAVFYGSDDMAVYYSLAITTAVFHLINHATFKGSLFMAVGVIDHETGTRDIRQLGGLLTWMPITATISFVGLASMAGLPPFNGFISKEMFFSSFLQLSSLADFSVSAWSGLLICLIWIASIFTFLYCAIMFKEVFMKKAGESAKNIKLKCLIGRMKEAPFGLLISPGVLACLVLLLGLFPDLLKDSVLVPAVSAIVPDAVANSNFNIHLSMFHGFNWELLMTVGVIGIGIGLLFVKKRWENFKIYKNERDPINRLYDFNLEYLVKGSAKITNLHMNGRLRDYLSIILIFMVTILTYTGWRTGAFHVSSIETADIPYYMWILAGIVIAATIYILRINNRITFVIIMGIIGFLVSLFYVLLNAPDLALTQLLVETVTVILFMVAFYHLPEFSKNMGTLRLNKKNLLISIAVGILVPAVAISAYGLGNAAGFSRIAEYFTENAKTLGGGYNVVNVILVDFRGMDTMLEILVLGIVALAVVAMIKLRFKGGEDV